MIDVNKIREDFPVLHQKIYKSDLVYFDNAATTQKPRQVINTLVEYYEKQNSNIHRGVHTLSQRATEAFEIARRDIQKFINAENHYEIIFTRGTTESINLVASSFCKRYLSTDDEIIISAIEHHSNIVPWQMACEEHKAKLKVIPVFDNGELDLEEFVRLINSRTKLIAITHVSNTLGTINPIKEIIQIAHNNNVPVLIDGAQAVSHIKVDVQELDCDFYCFSGHKVYAPMGIGVLYGKEKYLEQMPPYQGGGEMIKDVTFERTTYNELPFKFEAGTPNVGDALALQAAIRYINEIGFDNISNYEHELLKYATEELLKIDGVRIIGTAKEKTSVVSFLIGNIHPYDAGTIMDKLGIAVRTGNHCTQPIMDRYGIPGTIRASFAFYNTKEEIDQMIVAIKRVKTMFE